MSVQCQIYDSDIRYALLCPHEESGGVRCERMDSHGDDHWISGHTIAHSIAGSGFSCQCWEEKPPIPPYRNYLAWSIMGIQAELYELDRMERKAID